jgi:hypothetical protein
MTNVGGLPEFFAEDAQGAFCRIKNEPTMKLAAKTSAPVRMPLSETVDWASKLAILSSMVRAGAAAGAAAS